VVFTFALSELLWKEAEQATGRPKVSHLLHL
jgi:hypothetical protein